MKKKQKKRKLGKQRASRQHIHKQIYKSTKQTHVGYLGSSVPFNNFRQVFGTGVTIPAQVKTQRPKGWHGRSANQRDILLNNLQWGWATEDVEVKDTTEGAICQAPLTSCIWLKSNL